MLLLPLLLAAAPATFSFPSAQPDARVALDTSGEFACVDGVLTAIRSSSGPVFHRVDARRSLLVASPSELDLYDVLTHTLTRLDPRGGMNFMPVRDALVIVRDWREVCDVDPDSAALRTVRVEENLVRVLEAGPARLVVATKERVNVLRPGAAMISVALPAGFSVSPGQDVLRGDRVVLVRPGDLSHAKRSWDGMTWAEPVPWKFEVAVLDVGTGALVPPVKVPGGWSQVIMNCCSGFEPTMWVEFVSAATARARLDASARIDGSVDSTVAAAVVDEWNEVVTWRERGRWGL